MSFDDPVTNDTMIIIPVHLNFKFQPTPISIIVSDRFIRGRSSIQKEYFLMHTAVVSWTSAVQCPPS